MAGFEYLNYEVEHRVPEIDGAGSGTAEIVDFDHSAVDFDHLQRFTMGNRSLEQEVLTLFRTQSMIYMKRLREADDDRGWQEAAHTLKGSAAGIGAHRVREAAAACEQICGESCRAEREDKLGRLDGALSEANLLIAKFLND